MRFTNQMIRHESNLNRSGFLSVLNAAKLVGIWSMLLAIGFSPVRAWAEDPKPADKKEEKKNEPKPADKKEEKKEEPAPVAPTMKDGKVVIDPATQQKIDELVTKEQGKKGEEPSKQEPAKPATPPTTPPVEEKAGRRGTKGKTTGKPGNTAGDAIPAQPNVGVPGGVPAGDTGPSATINIPPADNGDTTPPEDKMYRFSIKDGTYEQLIEGIAHQTGLGVFGEAPKDGKCTFIADEPLTFDMMLDRVRTILRNYKPLDPYTITRNKDGLLVIRVNDYLRFLPEERMFRTVELFLEAKLTPNELAFVVFTPKTGAISDLQQVRDFLPDYFRVTPLDAENAVSLYGFASDIEKYLRLVGFFAGEKNDPRTIERIRILHITPSDAVAKLSTFMDVTGTARAPVAPKGNRGGVPDAIGMIAPPAVSIMPDDASGEILIRAMKDKIDEIKLLLPYVDIDTTASYPPVIIPVKHADPNTLLTTIQQILAVTDAPASGGAPGVPQPMPAPPPAGGSKKGKKSSRIAAASPVATDSINMFVHPSSPAIIAIGAEEEVAHVRQLVEQFDVPDVVGPLKIPLKHGHAVDMATTLFNMIGGATAAKPSASAGSPQFISDNSGDAIWFIGTERDLEKTRELIEQIDVAGEQPKLHIVRLQHQKASFVSNMLRELDGANPSAQVAAPQPATPDKPRGRKRTSAPTAVSKFTPDDDQNRLFVLCFDEEWTEYEALIKQLDIPMSEGPLFTRLAVANGDPNQIIEQLKAVVGEDGPRSTIQYLVNGNEILVFGAAASDLETMRTLLVEVDKPLETAQRTFEIKHADPEGLISIIERLVTGESTSPQPKKRGKKSVGAPDGAPGPTVVPGSGKASEELTLIPHGNKLIVRTSPAKMEQVASIIAEFDVADGKPVIRTYADFSPTADVGNIADMLETIIVGSSGKPGKGAPKEDGKPGVAAARFIPQPTAHRLVVVADPSQFAEIEEVLNVLRTDDQVEVPEVAFIDLQHADAEKVVTDIEPILELRVARLVEKGEIPEEPREDGPPAVSPSKATKVKKPKGTVTSRSSTGQKYHLAPAHGNKRIVVVATSRVIEEVRQLVAKFDVAGGDAPVFRTVELRHSNPLEMAKAIREMMGSAPRVVQTKDGGKEAPPTSRIRSAEEVLSIVEQPGGGGLVLYGPADDVEQAIQWITDLDARAAQGRLIKVYKFEVADVKDVVDLVMNVVDAAPAAVPGAKRPAGKTGKNGKADEDDESEDEFATETTRVGTDMYIKADLIGNTMLVAATQAKLTAIDAIVAQVEPKDDSGITIIPEKKSIPKHIYELKYAEAWDARIALEAVLEVYWDDPNKLPDVTDEEIGDAQVLVVKYPDEERFAEIEDLILKFADKPKKEDIEAVRKVIAVPAGVNAEEAAKRLMDSFRDIPVELNDVSAPEQEDFGVIRVRAPKTEKSKKDTQAKAPPKANPCVMPTAFRQGILAMSLGQSRPSDDEIPDERSDDEAAAEVMRQLGRQVMGKNGEGDSKDDKDSKDKKESRLPRLPEDEQKPLKVTYDKDKGVLVLEGASAHVDVAKDVIEDLGKEAEEMGLDTPDIRIYRVRYIDLDSAQNILEEMFNMSRQMRQQMDQQNRAMMQAAAAQARAQGQPGQQPGQPGQPGGRGGDQANQPGGRGARGGNAAVNPAALMVPQMPQSTVRVYPNPRDRTLILRADTRQYPAIMELLATIDQPQPINARLKVFPLEKLNAADVEAVLKEMIGLDSSGRSNRARRAATPGGEGGVPTGVPAGGAGGSGQLPEQIMDTTAVGDLGIDTTHIKISSNAEANTVLVMAPEAALKYIGDIINQLESHEGPPREVRQFYLKHADPEELALYLTTHFEESTTQGRKGRAGAAAAPGGSASSGKSLNTPTFTPYPRLMLLTAQAAHDQIVKIEELVKELDVPSKSEELQSIPLTYADAKQVADTLTALFLDTGSGGGSSAPGRRGAASVAAAGPRFIGEEGGNILVFSAPEALHEKIREAVTRLDNDAKDKFRPRTIQLEFETPSKVADAIEAAYAGRTSSPSGRGGSGSGAARGKSRFTISAHDSSKRLFVVADDAMFTEIESFAKSLDKQRDMGVDFRVYPLKWANAKKVHGIMAKMIQEYMTRLPADMRSNMEAFSVEVDEKTNSLIVLGGPVVFGFVEKSLQMVDNPANAGGLPGELTMTLINSDATEVAQNLQQMWAGKALPPGETAPTIVANRSGNIILVKGMQSQVDEVKKQIEAIENAAVPQTLTETIKLQFAQAEEVAAVIKRIFDERNQAAQTAGKFQAMPAAEKSVVVTPDPNTSQLIVQASAKNMALIKERVAELDKADVALGTVDKVYLLKRADPNVVSNMIKEWGRNRTVGSGGQNTRVALRDQVQAYAETATQSVIVTASEANHTRIKDLIASIDTDDPSKRMVEVVAIKNADPASVARALSEIYVRGGAQPRGGEPAISITEAQGSRAVVVKASASDMERIKLTVKELDSEALGTGSEVRVVAIKSADATEIQTSVQSIMAKPGAGGGRGPGADLMGGARVSVLTGSNSVVISGDRAAVDDLEAKIIDMDNKAGEQGGKPVIIRLAKARISQVMPVLEQMYLQQRPGGSGRTSQQQTVITPVEPINGFSVQASPMVLNQIKTTIEQLDIEEIGGSQPFRIVQLAAGVNVTDVAEKVMQSLNDSAMSSAGAGGGQGGRRDVASVTLTPDRRTNSIIISGSSQLFDQAESMIKQLEQMGPVGGLASRVIKTKTIKAEDAERIIEELKRRAEGEGSSGGSRGGTSRPRTTPSRPR